MKMKFESSLNLDLKICSPNSISFITVLFAIFNMINFLLLNVPNASIYSLDDISLKIIKTSSEK